MPADVSVSSSDHTPEILSFNPEAKYRAVVSDEMNQFIVRLIRDGWNKGPAVASGLYKKDQAWEVGSRMRRAEVESKLLDLQQFSGVRTSSLKSSSSTFYVRVDVEDLVVIAARANSSEKMIKKSAYRTNLAKNSLQANPSLFDWVALGRPELAGKHDLVSHDLSLFEAGDESENSKLYAVILYGARKSSALEPEFIIVRFPDPLHDRYLHGYINLKKEYWDSLDVSVVQTEVIQDKGTVKLKPGSAATGEGSA